MSRRKRRRTLRARKRVPLDPIGAPSDDELLRYLDGAMGAREAQRMAERLQKAPLSRARLEMLAEALEENGWRLLRKPGRGSA